MKPIPSVPLEMTTYAENEMHQRATAFFELMK